MGQRASSGLAERRVMCGCQVTMALCVFWIDIPLALTPVRSEADCGSLTRSTQRLGLGNREMHDRLSTIGSISHRDRSPSIAAQETSQANEPQKAEEAPFAGVIVISGLDARRWRHLHSLPRGRLRQRHGGRYDRQKGREE